MQAILVVLGAFAILSIGYLFTTPTESSIDRVEKYECQRWQEEAAKYQGFYLVQWQADQCKFHGIKVNAPIK